MKKRSTGNYIARSAATIGLALFMLLNSSMGNIALAGEAIKSIVGGGTHSPNDEVTVELKISRPDLQPTPVAELVVVVDTSASMADDIASLKTKLTSFVDNTLAKYPGLVGVGITKIGNGRANFDNQPATVNTHNTAMYPAGTTLSSYTNVRLPNATSGIEKVATISTTTDINRLKTAISNIAIEQGPNSTQYNGGYEQRDQTNSYTSDIGPGMESGVDMFTSANNEKFMLLLTDGLANKGFCPINSSGGKASQIGWITGTHLQVISSPSSTLGGVYNQYVPTEHGHAGDPVFPSNYPSPFGEPGVCQTYISSKVPVGLLADNLSPHYDSNFPQNSMLQNIATVFGGTRSSNIDSTTLSLIANLAKIASINVKDTLNPAVFSQITSWVGLFDCTTGTQYTGNDWNPSGTSFDLTLAPNATAAFTNGTVQYLCIRFKAKISTSPSVGDNNINTTSTANKVDYLNSNGTSLATDTVSEGTISITGGSVDINPKSFNLTNSSGTSKRVFTTTDAIYIDSSIANDGDNTAQSGSITRYYANQATAVAVNQDPPTPSACLTHGGFGAHSLYNYDSYPGGEGADKFKTTAPCAVSWTQPTVGIYTARMVTNFNGTYETSGASGNNQTTYRYASIVPPSNLSTVVNSCKSVTFNWTAGQGITRYRIHLTNTTDGNEADYYATGNTYTQANLTDGPKNYSWSLTPQVQIDGTYYEGDTINGAAFTTPTCKQFSVTMPPVSLQPKGDTGLGTPLGNATSTTNITYTSSGSSWTSSDSLRMRIRSLSAGNVNCNTISPKIGSAVSGTLGGLTVSLPGNEYTFNYPASPVIAITADATVPQGTYTACIVTYSPTNSAAPTDGIMSTLVITVNIGGWMQVGGVNPAATGAAGDVFSNGDISEMVLPVQKYFFITPTPGVISASGSINIPYCMIAQPKTNPNPCTSSSQPGQQFPWIAKNYPSTVDKIKTTTYDALLVNADNGQTPGQTMTTLPANTNLASIINSCNSGVSATYHITGDASVGTSDPANPDVTMPSSCNNVQLVFMIDGNLNIYANVYDQTNTSTITYIVKNDVAIRASVTEADGVYVFGQRFKDNASDTQLIIRGSLIGLSGQTPGSSTGSFTQTNGMSGLQRDRGETLNKTEPSEIIYFQPKYLYLLKNSFLGRTTITWTE